jgi:hypothetical protein
MRSMSRTGFGVSKGSESGNNALSSFFELRLLPTSSFLQRVLGVKSATSERYLLMLGLASRLGPHQILLSFSSSLNLSSLILQNLPGGGLKSLPVGPLMTNKPLEYGLFANGSPGIQSPLGSLSGFEYIEFAFSVRGNLVGTHSGFFE